MSVANPGVGGVIKIGIFCNIKKIHCFPFVFLLGNPISCSLVQKEIKTQQSARGISLPLAPVNE